jgi:hypothetical protein
MVVLMIVIAIISPENINLLPCRTNVTHNAAKAVSSLIGQFVHIHGVTPDFDREQNCSTE